MRRLSPSDYRRMPWRNGGGTTTELVVSPEGGALAGERFLYRVSIADVASDGPFSRFDGYDRHIMLLAGTGMVLDAGADGRIGLSAPFQPRSFPGEWNVTATLLGGPSRDFNLIVDRERAVSTLSTIVEDGPFDVTVPPGGTVVLHIVEGALQNAAAGDTLVVARPDRMVPMTRTRLVVCVVAPRER